MFASRKKKEAGSLAPPPPSFDAYGIPKVYGLVKVILNFLYKCASSVFKAWLCQTVWINKKMIYCKSNMVHLIKLCWFNFR